MSRAAATLLVALLMLLSSSASAHKPSDSYLLLDGTSRRVALRWDVALRDLDAAIGLDTDGDGAVSWAELQAAEEMVKAYAGDGIELRTPRGACVESFGETRVVQHTDGAYAALQLEVRCPDAGVSPRLRYRLLFDIDAQHRAIVKQSSGAPLILTKERPDATLELAPSGWSAFVSVVRLGIEHILEGYDHLLFLLALLLPSVLRREGRRWVAVDDFRSVARDVLRVVTAFTVAHSLTLGLAAGGWLMLPGRFVESAIALSVVLAALNNLWPMVRSERWLAAFGLGLLHGFGFASALSDIGLSAASYARTVFGFNLGVELGQLGVVLLLLPLLHCVRGARAYQSMGLRFGSLAVLAVSTVWFLERAFDWKLIS